MRYLLVFTSLFTILTSCNQKQPQLSKVETVKTYYDALNRREIEKMPQLFADSILQKEIDYRMPFDKTTYLELCKWDMAFEPKYEIFEISEINNGVKVRMSKTCKRIQFLHEKPTIAEEFFEFENGKIRTLGATRFIEFDDTIWMKNRRKLTRWIDNNYPEMNGFIYNQTPQGAANYLKAIALYNSESNQ